jgi:hypothetical protein
MLSLTPTQFHLSLAIIITTRFRNRLLKLRRSGESHSQIAQILNREGKKTANDKEWYAHVVAAVTKEPQNSMKNLEGSKE